MSRRRGRQPSSLPLPLYDDIGSPSEPPADAPLPTVFISYSHDTPAHVARVQFLAAQLKEGDVHCEIDTSQISPPQGWPLWMQEQIERSDFVIVVCTATYAGRFTGLETLPGRGKGVRWEGRLINQCLYESAENHRFIPVVFSRHDLNHIPLVLKGATHYDVSTVDGYNALHNALTHPGTTRLQPRSSVVVDLTAPSPVCSEITALLRLCPDPLPLPVIARAVGQETAVVATSLRQLLRDAVTSAHAGYVPSSQVLGLALQADLDFVDNHRDTAAGRAQLRNVLALAEAAADVGTASVQVSRTFHTIHTMLKVLGDKHLVLKVARRSIEASKAEGRTRDQAKDEAVAAICGVSWVYQRTGRLSEALVEAERSLALGRNINWKRNTAFCCKCIGRLRRMQSEMLTDAHERTALLKASVESLQEAIEQFTRLSKEAEVGDCYSLLARTYLGLRKKRAARDAVEQADGRLVDRKNKDYLDLQIVKGDLVLANDPAVADTMYTEVIATTKDTGDAQKSEIVARAHLQRARARAALGQKERRSLEDLRRAAAIWDSLKDPAADLAHWEIARTASWMDKKTERRLMSATVNVRVCAVRIIAEEAAGRPGGIAQRRTFTDQYLRGVITKAKERAAVDRPAW